MAARNTRAKKAPADKRTRKRTAAHKQTQKSRTVAEARGLAARDAKISAKPPTASINIIDNQFRMWSAMLRMSPLPFVLQQQAAVAKLIIGFLLPGKPGR